MQVTSLPPASSSSSEPGNTRVAGASGFLLGIVTVIVLVAGLIFPSNASGATTLSAYVGNPSFFYLLAAVIGLFAVVGVPYFTALGRILRPRGAALAAAATYLSILGLFVAAVGVVGYVSLLASINGATGGSPATASFIANVVGSSLLTVTLLGFTAFGLGMLLYGLLSWKSRTLPNWLAVVGIVTGAAGVTTFIPVVGFVTAFVGLAAFVVWCFVSALVFLGPMLRSM